MTDTFSPDVSTSTTRVIYPPDVAAQRAAAIATIEARRKMPQGNPPDWWNGPDVMLPVPTHPTEYVRDLSNVSRRDGYLFVGQASVDAVNEYARFMSPNDAAMFNSWAKTHPTMDPRTWHSMAMAHILPMDPDGKSVAYADEVRQANEGTRELVIGMPNQKPSNAKPPINKGNGMDLNPMDWVNAAGNGIWSATKLAIRGPFTLLQSGVQAAYAPMGVSSTQDRFRQDLALKYHLTPADLEELGWNSSLPSEASKEGRPYYAMLKSAYASRTAAYQRQGMTATEAAMKATTETHPDLMEKARKDLASRGEGGGLHAQIGRAGQTVAAVQAAQHPGELFAANEGIFASGKISARQAAAAEKFTNMRSFQEAQDFDKAVQDRTKSINDINEQAALSAGQGAIMDYLLEHPAATQDELEKVARDAIDRTPVLNLSQDPHLTFWQKAQAIALPLGSAAAKAKQTEVNQAVDAASYAELHKNYAPVAWTLGRAIAQPFWDPDTVAYNTISGGIDFIKYLVGDPAMLIPADAPVKLVRSVSEAADIALSSPLAARLRADRLRPVVPGQTARALEAGQELRAVRTTMQYAGRAARAGQPARPPEMGGFLGAHPETRGADVANLFRQAGRPDMLDPLIASRAVYDDAGRMRNQYGLFVAGQRAWDYLNRPIGQAMVRSLTAEQNAAKILLLSNGGFTADVAIALADATTEAEVRAIIGSRMGREFTDPSQFGGYAQGIRAALVRNAALKDGWITNLFRMAPKGGAFANDPDVMFHEAIAFARGVGLKSEPTLQHLDKIIRAHPGDELYQAFYGDSGLMGAVTQYLMDRGASLEHARTLTRSFKGGMDDTERRNFEARIGSGSLAISDLSWQPKVLLEHEQLGSMLQLPNYRDVRRAGNIVSNITKSVPYHEQAEIFGKLANSTVSLWRNATLMRPAYVLRELIDLTVSQGLAGHSSMLTHPVHALSLAIQAANGYAARTMPGRLSRAILSGTDPERLMQSLNYRRDEIRKAFANGEVTRTAVARRYAATGLQEVVYRAGVGQGVQAVALAKYLNTVTSALMDHLGFAEGMARLAPSLDQSWYRVNGKRMWDDLNDFVQTGDVDKLGTIYNGTNAAHGNFVQDERAARARSGTMTPMSRDVPEHASGYARGIIEALWDLHQDRDVRNMSDPRLPFLEVLDRFRNGTRDFKKIKRPDLLNDANPNLDYQYLSHLLDETRRVTIDDDLLTEAVVTGKFAGKPLDVHNQELRDYINKLKVDRPGEMLPAVGVYKLDPSKAKDWVERADRLVNWFFGSMGEVTDMMVRAPAMREVYVSELQRIGPSLSKEAKAQAIRNLDGDPKLQKVVRQIDAKGTLSVDSMEAILDAAVPQEMGRIFYDASKRGNYQVAFRTVFPFAQATFNTFKRWGLMSLANPQNMYRVVRPINALMQPGSAFLYELLGLATGDESMQSMWTPDNPESNVNGFFYSSGFPGQPTERMFAMPVVGSLQSSLLSSLTGTPNLNLRSEARAQSLNVAGVSLNPGMGPMYTWLASTLGVENAWSRKDTEGKIVRFFFPYGLPEGGVVAKTIGAWFPTWAQKLARADDGSYNASQAVKLRPILEATGDYDTSKPVDVARLDRDTARLSIGVYGLGALFGTIAPTQINNLATMMLNDPSDPSAAIRFFTQAELSKVFRKYTAGRTSDQYDQARAQFVADFGVGALNSVLPITVPAKGGVPTATNDVWEFYTKSKHAYEAYLPVIGLFFSGDDLNSALGREFSPELSRAQRAAGERRYLTLHEAQVRSDQQIGWMLYNQKTKEIDALPLADQQKLVLKSRTRLDIQEHYPQWSGEPTDPGSSIRLLTEMKKAVKDPDIATLPSAPYIANYLQARDETIKYALDHGMTEHLDAVGMRVGAALLIRRAQLLAQEDTSGGFRNFWNRVARGEFGQ